MKQKKTSRTKIIATIGPASGDEKTMLRMIQNGMRVARLNFSHGRYEDHSQAIEKIRRLSEQMDQPVALLQDLSGPKIRLSEMAATLEIRRGDTVTLGVSGKTDADLTTDFKDFTSLVKPGHTILIDDGYIELTALSVSTDRVKCRVVDGGTVASRKGINLPDISTPMKVFTRKDSQDLAFGLEQGIDMVAMSFVDSADNIIPIRRLMKQKGRFVPAIAKVERSQALKNIDGIIDSFDGIMLARGDLGVEIPAEQVPLIQKQLLQKAGLQNKITITATQMLESMISNPRPTRAEASDVANAILDGSDAIMLSGETAVGQYPDVAVDTMRKIAMATENSSHFSHCIRSQQTNLTNTEAIVRSAVDIARELRAQAILVFSFTGNTALKISKYRPPCPVHALTSRPETVHRMVPFWGITPQLVEFTPQIEEMILKGEEQITTRGLLKTGDLVVIVSGPTPTRGATNMLKLFRIP